MRKGAEKYDERNWEKGIPISRCIASLERHLLAFKSGSNDEDHMAAIRTNASFIMHFQEMIARGRLPATLNDMPDYRIAYSPPGTPIKDWSPQDHHLMKAASTDNQVFIKDPEIFRDNSGHLRIPPAVRRPHVYIAGPMRGYKDFNFPAFDRARDEFQVAGWEPISPADLDRASGVNETSAPQFKPEQVRAFVERDSKALLSLRAEKGDAIAMLPGWEQSTGATAEFFMARWLGLKILAASTHQPLSDSWVSFGLIANETRNYMRMK